MQKPPSKADLSKAIENASEAFLAAGNRVTEVPRGVSGKAVGENPIKPSHWQMEKSDGERTYLPEVVQALDERKKPKPVSRAKPRKRPRKKLLYDDFGEPLRWVWVDE